MVRRYLSGGLILILFFMINCCVTEKNQDFSDSLIVLNDAFDIKFARLNGAQQVVYSVIAPYPALNVISEINDQLKTKGWRALEKDWLNPQTPTSHVRGWTDYIDETKSTNKEVHSWYSNWKNPQDDILIFSLTYSRPEKTDSIMSNLQVVAIYIPKELAKKRLSQMSNFKNPKK